MLRTLAQIISLIFHPLLMLTYMLVLLMLINPYLFGVNDISGNIRLILVVFFSTFFIPAFAILMLKFLGMVDSLELKTKQERIGPFIITGIFYMWMFRVFLDHANIPVAFTICVLGATIGLFTAFLINLFTKISLHALGMGGLIGMVAITMWLFSDGHFLVQLGHYTPVEISMNLLLMLVLLLSGLVGTARLLLGAHDPQDLVGGYLVGLISMFVALKFMI